jgi:DNA-binding transcriptional LysR family regulator
VPELRQLRYFIAVAEELNFSRAARRLNISQPPLSVAIRQLEQELGTSLFVRSSREVRLTEAGSAFLAGARRVLAEADGAVRAAQRAGAGEAGSLHVGYSWSARFETLPAIGRAFRQRRPDVELLAEEMWNGRMPAALRSGAIDVAVALWPEVAGELEYLPVRRERVAALLAVGHPLAGGGPVALGTLAEDDFLLFPRDLAPRLYDFFVALCRSAGFEPRVDGDSFHTRWTIGSWEERSVGLVPESACKDLPHGVVAALLDDPAEQIETQLMWRRGDDSPTVAAFVEVVKELFTSGVAGTSP